MYLMRMVAHRDNKMGLKLVKFHNILHIVDNVTLYGVPLESDTSPNESHHIPTKQAARLTQQTHSTFNKQTAERLVDFGAIGDSISVECFRSTGYGYCHFYIFLLEGQKERVLGYSIEDCRFTLDMMSAGRIDPAAMITDRISLNDLPEAFEALRRPTHQCKVMLTP